MNVEGKVPQLRNSVREGSSKHVRKFIECFKRVILMSFLSYLVQMEALSFSLENKTSWWLFLCIVVLGEAMLRVTLVNIFLSQNVSNLCAFPQPKMCIGLGH